jgi:hypothetical protein
LKQKKKRDEDELMTNKALFFVPLCLGVGIFGLKTGQKTPNS